MTVDEKEEAAGSTQEVEVCNCSPVGRSQEGATLKGMAGEDQ